MHAKCYFCDHELPVSKPKFEAESEVCLQCGRENAIVWTQAQGGCGFGFKANALPLNWMQYENQAKGYPGGVVSWLVNNRQVEGGAA